MQVYDVIFSGLLISLVLALVSLTFLVRWIRAEKSNVRIILSIIFLILLTLSLLTIWWYIFEITPLEPNLAGIILSVSMFAFLLYPLLRCTTSNPQPKTIDDYTKEQGWIGCNRESIVLITLLLSLNVVYEIYEGRVTPFLVFYILPVVILLFVLLRSSRSEETSGPSGGTAKARLDRDRLRLSLYIEIIGDILAASESPVETFHELIAYFVSIKRFTDTDLSLILSHFAGRADEVGKEVRKLIRDGELDTLNGS